MVKEVKIKVQGVITDILPNTQFMIRLENDHVLKGYLCGKMRKYRLKILTGDKVDIEMSNYDPSICRIIYRYK
ncbi:MAG: translation initiation factor IF-1 [Oligoflexia bacterium]|nr:translation initiation factor IF-1 [Oligoflexia bacterium]